MVDLVEDIMTALEERRNFNNEKLRMISYAVVIAELYQQAPLKDSKVTRSYAATIDNINTLYNAISEKFGIEIIPTEEDPYSSDEEMIRSISDKKVIKVYSGDSEHPFYDPETNVKFRAVHDIFSHYLPHRRSFDADGNLKFKGYDFSYPGEIDAYHAHKRYSKRECWPAYFSEIIGQVSYQAVTGKFGTQKMVWFGDDVDISKVGVLTGAALDRQQEILKALSTGGEIQNSPIQGITVQKVLSSPAFNGKGGKF